MSQISRRRFSALIQPGWEVEILERPGGRILSHFSDGPLPKDRSDFGGHALESLPRGRIFVAVFEYDRSAANEGMFRGVGIPHFFPSEFSANHLHRYWQGHVGAQKFFSEAGRSFGCYVVIVSSSASVASVAKVNRALSGIRVS